MRHTPTAHHNRAAKRAIRELGGGFDVDIRGVGIVLSPLGNLGTQPTATTVSAKERASNVEQEVGDLDAVYTTIEIWDVVATA